MGGNKPVDHGAKGRTLLDLRQAGPAQVPELFGPHFGCSFGERKTRDGRGA